MSTNPIRIRKTPNGRHLYAATMRGQGAYGWGNTPAEARAKLAENLESARIDREMHRVDLLRTIYGAEDKVFLATWKCRL